MCIRESTAFRGKVDESSKEMLLCKNRILDIESQDLRSGRRHLEEDLECFVSKVELLVGFESYGMFFMAW